MDDSLLLNPNRCHYALITSMYLNWGIILAKGQLATIHYDSAPRPQKSCFAHPNIRSLAAAACGSKIRAKFHLLYRRHIATSDDWFFELDNLQEKTEAPPRSLRHPPPTPTSNFTMMLSARIIWIKVGLMVVRGTCRTGSSLVRTGASTVRWGWTT